MAKIERFEVIEAWQKGRELSKAIYVITGQGGFARDFGLRDQMRRAAVSVMSNIAGGYDRGGNREFVQFLSIAEGCAVEVQAQLYVALDAEYIDQEQFDSLYHLAADIGRLMADSSAICQTRIQGSKI